MSDNPQGENGTAVTGSGSAADGRMAAGEQAQTLTTRQGHPVYDNQNSRTVGNRGPATLENYQLIEKISHFDRERIPERVVHARGAGAHGTFEAYGTVGGEPIERYTRAKLFSKKGKETPVFTRFSTVIHSGHSPETLRDPRGFAVKFYTEDGNWDLVGNNLKVFFIRDAIKFPDVIHSLKPDPITNRQDGGRIFDFMSNTPEAMHMLTFLFSPWGIPANYRQMQGSGVNTYKWVNQEGVGTLVKYHWEPQQGIKNLTQPEAEAIQAKNFNHATQDLYEAIETGNFPKWELRVQLMEDGEHPELDFDPLDDTKLWPEDQFPHLAVGMMTLNRNPENYFAEVEQVAYGTGVLVDGLDFSDDKMLQGRTFSYSDTQRYRVGTNYLQLPINAPKKHVATNQRDGQMTFHVDTAPNQNPHVNYEPSSINGLSESPRAGQEHEPMYQARLVRQKTDRHGDVDFKQAGERWRLHNDLEKEDLIDNLSDAISAATPEIQARMVSLFSKCDPEYGQRLQAALDVIAKNPSAATGRYLGRRASNGSNSQNGHASNGNGQNGYAANGNGQRDAHGQPGANEAVKQAEEMAHDARPY